MFKDAYTKYDLKNIIGTNLNFFLPIMNFSMNINLDLHRFPKNSTCLHIYRNAFKENCSISHPHTHIYTDASLIEKRVWMAIICEETTIQWKLSNNCSTYSAEALAILKAIEYIISNVDDDNITIFSYSFSTLTSLQNQYTTSDIVKEIKSTQYIAQQYGKSITYFWILGHCSIPGNEQADAAAKLAYSSADAIILPMFSFNDIKRVIEDNTSRMCQREWN